MQHVFGLNVVENFPDQSQCKGKLKSVQSWIFFDAPSKFAQNHHPASKSVMKVLVLHSHWFEGNLTFKCNNKPKDIDVPSCERTLPSTKSLLSSAIKFSSNRPSGFSVRLLANSCNYTCRKSMDSETPWTRYFLVLTVCKTSWIVCTKKNDPCTQGSLLCHRDLDWLFYHPNNIHSCLFCSFREVLHNNDN